jgi:hypothetical protein
MGYFVPNFGIDKSDVQNTDDSLRVAEKQLGHHWHFEEPKKGDGPVIYNDQRPYDPEIQTSL